MKKNAKILKKWGEEDGGSITAPSGQDTIPYAEMEKRGDSADIPVLFFLIAVLIFWLYTRKPAKTMLALC